jgi:hypothetical protein
MQTVESGLALLRESTIHDVKDRQQHFLAATPFKHVVIEHFFNDAFARQLLDGFPPVGNPATPTTLSDLAPAYRAADDLFASSAFLKWAEDLSGIRHLAYVSETFWSDISPRFGAGISLDADGRQQLPHVDFKFDSTSEYRRRLGFVVFLNEGWQSEWGGLMQLHPEPGEADRRGMRSYEPVFNRCVIFETREKTRHGFSKITLPVEQATVFRRSMCVYLFTLEGHDLTHRARLVSYGADIAATSTIVMLPILGYVRQVGEPAGFHFDGWAGDDVRFSIEAIRPVTGLTLKFSVPEHLPVNAQLEVWAGEHSLFSGPIEPAREFATTVPASIDAGATSTVRIGTSARFVPRELGVNEDPRALCFIIREISFEHNAR